MSQRENWLETERKCKNAERERSKEKKISFE